jgi:hypothetical protein
MLCWPCSVGVPYRGTLPFRGIMEGRPLIEVGFHVPARINRGMPETVRVSRTPCSRVRSGMEARPANGRVSAAWGDQPGVGWLERSGKMRPSVTERRSFPPHFCSSKWGRCRRGCFGPARARAKANFHAPARIIGVCPRRCGYAGMLCWPCSVGRTPAGHFTPFGALWKADPANRGGISRSHAVTEVC